MRDIKEAKRERAASKNREEIHMYLVHPRCHNSSEEADATKDSTNPESGSKRCVSAMSISNQVIDGLVINM